MLTKIRGNRGPRYPWSYPSQLHRTICAITMGTNVLIETDSNMLHQSPYANLKPETCNLKLGPAQFGPGTDGGKPTDHHKSFGVISATDRHESRSDPISSCYPCGGPVQPIETRHTGPTKPTRLLWDGPAADGSWCIYERVLG